MHHADRTVIKLLQRSLDFQSLCSATYVTYVSPNVDCGMPKIGITTTDCETLPIASCGDFSVLPNTTSQKLIKHKNDERDVNLGLKIEKHVAGRNQS
jgi:hypothetical protein